ncbi:pyridoxal phosphate-dependent aminotransferase [Fibrobacter sp.]|uniref:pyridoxal phosphate-dependent aminotransferase n=1 Tax=Fibrobacter sp. TaxID=35828 RepID=UPI003864A2F8
MLSSRLPKDLSPSPFFAELERAKADVFAECANSDALPLIDMTVSSPVKAGLPVDLDIAVDEGRKDFGNWNPDAAGWKLAREAVVEYYRERGGAFTAGQIILTASTSEAYSVLFKTFCDPGDVILTPMPGYPLLDTLAQLEHLECAPYFLKLKRENAASSLAQHSPGTSLRRAHDSSAQLCQPASSLSQRSPSTSLRAQSAKQSKANTSTFRLVLDSDSLLAAPERAKILLLVSPHNPTGHCISREEWNEAVRFCEENNMILVVDEVFGDYTFTDKVSRTWKYVLDERRETRDESENTLWDAGGGDFINLPKDGPKCPIFWLNGLSKAVGSPQLKLGWMAFYAPRENFEEIRAALEFVEDAYLSVSAPAQALGASLLKHSAAYESKVLERLQQNWQTLREAFPSKYCPEVLGGWYAVVRLGEDDEELTLRLLREKHVLVQPGFFFDFDEDGWVVMSLLQDPAIFKEAIERIKQ